MVRISPLMDDNERVLPIWVEVANPDHLLKDGMLAQVSLMTKASEPFDPSHQRDSAPLLETGSRTRAAARAEALGRRE